MCSIQPFDAMGFGTLAYFGIPAILVLLVLICVAFIVVRSVLKGRKTKEEEERFKQENERKEEKL